jgi:hypothetical protein
VAISIKLLGPGVIEETKQKSTRPDSSEYVMGPWCHRCGQSSMALPVKF